MYRMLGKIFLLLSIIVGGMVMTSCQSDSKGTPSSTSGAGTQVLVKTNMGEFTVELNDKEAPISTKNFLSYVDDKFYDGTIFHRVIETFMVQGGGFDAEMAQKPTKAPIQNEAHNGLKNLRGTLAMARTPDINSATAQFFINVVDNSFLDHRDKSPNGYGYAVFAKVVEGMDVVDKIKSVKTTNHGYHRDVPASVVVIESITRK